MKTLQFPLRLRAVGAGALAITALVGASLLSTSNSAQAQSRARVSVTPLPLNSPPASVPNTVPVPKRNGVPAPVTNSVPVPANNGGVAPVITNQATAAGSSIITSPVITYPGYGTIYPNNGVVYNPYGILPPLAYGGIADPSGAGVVGPDVPSAGPVQSGRGRVSVPTGNLTGRPIRVRSVPRQPAGTQRLLNNSNLPLVTGIVQTTPSRGVFTLLIGDEQVRIVQSRPAPQTLSKGDMVQIQGLRRGNVLRAGSISILRDR